MTQLQAQSAPPQAPIHNIYKGSDQAIYVFTAFIDSETWFRQKQEDRLKIVTDNNLKNMFFWSNAQMPGNRKFSASGLRFTQPQLRREAKAAIKSSPSLLQAPQLHPGRHRHIPRANVYVSPQDWQQTEVRLCSKLDLSCSCDRLRFNVKSDCC